jgi:hypothetical protein
MKIYKDNACGVPTSSPLKNEILLVFCLFFVYKFEGVCELF